MSNRAATEALSFHGIGIGGSKAMGKLRFLRTSPSTGLAAEELCCPDGDDAFGAACAQTPSAERIADERQRFEEAVARTRQRLSELSARAKESVGEEAGEIFDIHMLLLEDEDYRAAVEKQLLRGGTAEQCVRCAESTFSALLSSLSDGYLAARTADVHDVSALLLEALSGKAGYGIPNAEEPFLLVAQELTPSQTMSLDMEKILGIVTFGGSVNSHASILAQSMGIPALVGVGVLDSALEGCLALLDSVQGSLIVSPDEAATESFRELCRMEQHSREQERIRTGAFKNRPAVSKSGHRVQIYANIGDERQAVAAMECGADGIGLLRSELLYLSLERYPEEQELYTLYRHIVERMEGRRVIIRTLDIGADKQAPYFELPHEENPALGFRAIRVCLARRELFRTQLCAILRASVHGKVALMLPMVTSVQEVLQCKELLRECRNRLLQRGQPFDEGMELGVMIETPAAALMAQELAQEVDFFSVGTNDLTQYTLAADRQNPLLSQLVQENTEPVLRLIRMATEAMHKRGGWVGICGEMAADLTMTQAFVNMKIEELSVSPPLLLPLREKVLECD